MVAKIPRRTVAKIVCVKYLQVLKVFQVWREKRMKIKDIMWNFIIALATGAGFTVGVVLIAEIINIIKGMI